MNQNNSFFKNKFLWVIFVFVVLMTGFFILGKKQEAYDKNQNRKEKTEESAENNFHVWHDLEDRQNQKGVISEGEGMETNISVTPEGWPVASFEDKANGGRIRVRIFKNNHWNDLTDENNPNGLVSFGNGGNPTTVSFGGNIYAAFMEYEDNNRARVKMWSEKEKKWNDLEDKNHPQGFLTEFRGHEPVLIKGEGNNLVVIFSELNRKEEKDEATDSMAMAIRIWQWNGEEWQNLLTNKKAEFIGAEIGGFYSEEEKKLFLVFEDRALPEVNRIRAIYLDKSGWHPVGNSEGIIESTAGYSPAIDSDEEGNIFLTYTKGKPGELAIWRANKKENYSNWHNLKENFNESGEAIESSIVVARKGIFVAYSEYVKNAPFLRKTKNDKYEDEISDGWKVRVKRLDKGQWFDVADDFYKDGYITKSDGKGDSSLAVFDDKVFVSITDREYKNSIRIKFCDLNKIE